MCLLFQLDYKVNEKKLRDVFRMAGNVKNCELKVDKEGKSRGMGIVQFDHPVEAVQAICILSASKFMTDATEMGTRQNQGPRNRVLTISIITHGQKWEAKKEILKESAITFSRCSWNMKVVLSKKYARVTFKEATQNKEGQETISNWLNSLKHCSAMFHDQMLFDRAMKVRMDKMGSTESSGSQGIPDKLPCEFFDIFKSYQHRCSNLTASTASSVIESLLFVLREEQQNKPLKLSSLVPPPHTLMNTKRERHAAGLLGKENWSNTGKTTLPPHGA